MSEDLNKEVESWFSTSLKAGTLPKGFTDADHSTLREMAWLADRGSRIYKKGNRALAERLRISTRSVTNRHQRLYDFVLIELISGATSNGRCQEIRFTLQNGGSPLPALETATVEVHDPNGGSELLERWKSTTETVEADCDPTYNQETKTEPMNPFEGSTGSLLPRGSAEPERFDPSQVITEIRRESRASR